MKPISQKTLNMIQYFKDHPAISVAKVAKKFKTSMPYTYKIRARAREESWQPPELLDTPETLDDAFGISLKDVPDHPAEVQTKATIAKAMGTSKVDAILDQRATQYGKFIEGAEIMQMLKQVIRSSLAKQGTPLAFDQLEALDMIVHKIGRIINGNPDNVDSWTDIAGYAKLVADRLEGRVR